MHRWDYPGGVDTFTLSNLNDVGYRRDLAVPLSIYSGKKTLISYICKLYFRSQMDKPSIVATSSIWAS
ncbi:hypothetical protein Y032_0019g3834 [Ancylostoma ceylanicum]|uniref:Uncharacterized protein n=1 Tax=Ancylostoma ceylanicum TaxID=53326 RepID=A0A016V371_9BILA|nr:hypothetical protein Y032_0019g3834 [Ancylostoma ceylanicum]